MPISSEKSKVADNSSQFEILDEGLYTVQVVDIVLKEGVQTKWGLKDKLHIHMGVLDKNENRGKKIVHFTSTAFTSGYEGGQASALYKFACSIYGQKLDAKMGLDLNTLIGGKCRVVIKHREYNGKIYSNVSEVLKVDRMIEDELSDEEIKKLMPKEMMSQATSESILKDIDADVKFDDITFDDLDLDS